MFDIIIIGAGVVGGNIARLLSQYKLKILLIEKEKDVSLGASKANSGIVHGGYVGKYGTLKGKLCLKGNQMFDQLNKELNFGYKKLGGLILGFTEEDKTSLDLIYENAIKVGQKDLVWCSQNELLELEPNSKANFALYSPSIGICSPYEFTIALVENAVLNGVELHLDEKVIDIKKDEYYTLISDKASYQSPVVINAAGIESALLNRTSCPLTIKARKGQYILFSKDQCSINHVIFQPPTKKGKGILVTPTLHGNLMIGPDAEDLVDPIDTNTSLDRLEKIIKTARKSLHSFDLKRALTTFSGIRAMSQSGDFEICYEDGFITLGGIDSPGLTSSPAIAEYVRDLLKEKVSFIKKDNFNANRESYFFSSDAQTICHCEDRTIEHLQACFKGPINIHTTDAAKRRIRSGMGPCQGHRCRPVVKRLISEYYGLPLDQIRERTEDEMPKRVSIQEIKKLEA